jgi:hypothetical protein
MRAFIDLRGASGQLYRFRLWPEGEAHPPIAGNFAIVRLEGGGQKVISVGLSNDLSQARPKTKERSTQIFTRLNVSRALRETEHADLAAAYPARAATRQRVS